MDLACREYVTTKLVEYTDSAGLGEALSSFLSVWIREKRIVGYQVVTVRSADDMIEHDLDDEAILDESGGVFPVIWINVTFAPDVFDPSDLSALERDYELRLIGEYAAGT